MLHSILPQISLFTQTTYSTWLLWLMVVVILVISLSGFIRLYFLSNANNTQHSKNVLGNPLVSIHLAICNEPPELVLKTILSIERLSYSNFELLVISNNTCDKNVWKPIEQKIMTLDNRFKFIHISKLSGYKAGALNVALKWMDKSSDYILTLDSDYTLITEALEIAIGTIQSRAIDILQFPQAYRNVSVETNGIEINYKHYFDCYLSSAKSEILALPTGTLTMINTKVFQNGTLWPTDSITEDASFGVDLIQQKLKLGFCNYILGRGTMPTETLDYSKQYKRWVFGNFQVLVKVWRTGGISIIDKIHLSTLLTAWLNYLGLVFILLMLSLPLLITGNPNALPIYYLGLLGILMHCLFQIFIYRKIAGKNLMKAWNGFLIHLGLLEIGAFHWMRYFISRKRPFIRTNKFLKAESETNRLYVFPLLILLFSTVCFILEHKFIASFYFLFGIQLVYAKFHKDQEIIWSKFNLYKLNK